MSLKNPPPGWVVYSGMNLVFLLTVQVTENLKYLLTQLNDQNQKYSSNLKWYYDEIIISFFSSYFESVFA